MNTEPTLTQKLVSRFGEPYTKDPDCLRLLYIIFDEAINALQEMGYVVHADSGSQPLVDALHDVICANRDSIMDAKLPADNGTWKQINGYELMSPYIDFRGVIPIWDDERKHYMDKLEQLVYKAYPAIYVEDTAPSEQLPIRYVLVLYDIWLQACISWSNPYSVITRGMDDDEGIDVPDSPYNAITAGIGKIGGKHQMRLFGTRF